jgi:hypothetical protein
MKQQGHADKDIDAPKREPRPYAINQNFPSQIGTAVDPRAVEQMHIAFANAPHKGPTDGMEEGPGANRTVKRSGSQGRH